MTGESLFTITVVALMVLHMIHYAIIYKRFKDAE